MPTRPNYRLPAAVAVVVALGVAVALVLLSRGDEGPQPSGTMPGSEPASPAPDRVLVVKIDNVGIARPQTGLAAADVVFVEPVEGGLTRLAAVYSSRLPQTVGPVRSARETDIELLAQYDHPTLAFSGAAPEILPLVHAAPWTTATPTEVPRAYFRDPARPAPHDLYVRPGDLPLGTDPASRHVLEFGPAPPGGVPTTDYSVRFRAASYDLHWSPDARRWLITMDGSPLVSTDSGQVTAATVVVQHVAVRSGLEVHDTAGSISPVALTVGTGPATVLRDGTAYSGTWSRPTPGDGTRFTTDTGEPLGLAGGPVWILLVPR